MALGHICTDIYSGYILIWRDIFVPLYIIIISLLTSPLLRQRPPFGSHIRRTGHNRQRGPSADWWVLVTENAVGNNGLTCLKHGGTRYKKTLRTLLNFRDRTLSALTTGHRAPSTCCRVLVHPTGQRLQMQPGHLKTDQCCFASTSALTAGPSSSSYKHLQ
jgi:hypothetical protein